MMILKGIPKLCVRVNTFLYIRKELEVMEKRVINELNSTGLIVVNDYRISFKLSLAACQVGTQEICEVTTDIIRTSYDGFLLVLQAGGLSRKFTHEDSSMIKEDFHLHVNLFWANGDGLPIELILPLFATDTESLIELFKSLISTVVDNNDPFPLPPPLTSGQWEGGLKVS
ncbi:mammalian uncoordinated homology 13 protein [Tanacetum coccineum]